MFPVINLSVKFDANIFISDRYIANLLFLWFGCEMPIPAHFGEVFWECDPLNVIGHCRDPQKAYSWPETRVLAYRSCLSVRNATWARTGKQQKGKKKRNPGCDVTNLPRPPTLRYSHQSCLVEWGPGHSQPCQVLSKSVQGFWLPEGSNLPFSYARRYGLYNRLGLPPNLW